MFALSSKQIQTSLNLIRLNVKHLNTIENKYRRIGPAGRILLKKFNIHESELPHLHFVSKGDVLEFLSKKEKSDTQIPRHKQIDTPVVNVKDESISNTINYLEYKNKLPHSYYSCTMKVDNLLEQMKEINEKHKKNVKLEDFIIKVKIILHYSR